MKKLTLSVFFYIPMFFISTSAVANQAGVLNESGYSNSFSYTVENYNSNLNLAANKAHSCKNPSNGTIIPCPKKHKRA